MEPETGAELPGPTGSSEAPVSSVPGCVSECLGVTPPAGSQPLKQPESEDEPETPSLVLTKRAGPVGLEERPVYQGEEPVGMEVEPDALEEGPTSGKSNSTCR